MYYKQSIQAIICMAVLLCVQGLQGVNSDEIKGDTASMDVKTEMLPGAEVSELVKHKVWIIPQPKHVQFGKGLLKTDDSINIKYLGSISKADDISKKALAIFKDMSISIDKDADVSVVLAVYPDGVAAESMAGLSGADIQKAGEQGYVLNISRKQISIASAGVSGLFYGLNTLRQIMQGRNSLPVMKIVDYPSMQYRGVHYDISSGQMPYIDALLNLSDTLAYESKANVLELYIEGGAFKWKTYPDIASKEGITPLEARRLFEHARANMMEVRPMMQVLGHFGIGNRPEYQKYMVRVPSSNTTVDVRNPEAVKFVSNLVDEICISFPAKYLNVDVTEIDDEGYRITGTDNKELPDLLVKYISELNDVTMKHGTRLMVAQCQLGAEGHLNGLGSRIDKLPEGVAVGSYYTAEFYGGWEHDYPLLQKLNIDYFVNCWIDSHARIMPYVGHAMDFSDITIKRGLQYGAVGSVSTEWGDAGNYHLPGVTVYPFMYHCASAWAGANLDREYFNQAFTRIMFGINDDSVSRGITIAGNINGRPLKIRNTEGIVETPSYSGNSTLGWYYNEFFNNPFTDPEIKRIADLKEMGDDIYKAGSESVKIFEKAKKKAVRNSNILDQLLFAAQNYEAMGRKLQILNRYNDASISRLDVAKELIKLADTYEKLKGEFRRLWLIDCKDAGTFDYLTNRFDQTIIPCREMAESLQNNKSGNTE